MFRRVWSSSVFYTGVLVRRTGSVSSEAKAESFHRSVFRLLTGRRLVTRCAAALTLVPVVHAAFSSGENKDKSHSQTAEISASDVRLIQKADELYKSNEVDLLYEHLLPSVESKNPELLWRLARATCDKGKSSSDPETKKKYMHEAFSYAKAALEVGDDSYASHKWYAIMLDYIGEYETTKERISKAYDIKEHFLRAIELNPEDATSVHLLGYWCFVFADLPWYQQKIASVLFATPPSSTYEEALQFFLQAENIDPSFYSMNLLMVGKTYLRLKNKEEAKVYLLRAKDYPIRTEDDKRANKEATELLQTL